MFPRVSLDNLSLDDNYLLDVVLTPIYRINEERHSKVPTVDYKSSLYNII